MTEEDAKTKWCPFVRAIEPGDQTSANRWPNDPFGGPTNTCIASACMAWRPTTALHAFDRDTGADLGPRSVINATREEFGRVPVGGYCGLSGS